MTIFWIIVAVFAVVALSLVFSRGRRA